MLNSCHCWVDYTSENLFLSLSTSQFFKVFVKIWCLNDDGCYYRDRRSSMSVSAWVDSTVRPCAGEASDIAACGKGLRTHRTEVWRSTTVLNLVVLLLMTRLPCVRDSEWCPPFFSVTSSMTNWQGSLYYLSSSSTVSSRTRVRVIILRWLSSFFLIPSVEPDVK
jgi:hypothetical protein